MIFFYKTTNLKNKKFYYGVHHGHVGDGYLGSGIALVRAIRKYGKDCFIREVLCEFKTIDEAYQHEAVVVTEALVDDPQCYNMRLGGKGGFDNINSNPNRINPMKNPETVKKCVRSRLKTVAQNPEKYRVVAIKNAKKGTIANIGKKRSKETKEKISAANCGRVCPDHVKDAVRQSRLGKRDSDETRKKKSESHKARCAAGLVDMGAWTRGKTLPLRLKPNRPMLRKRCIYCSGDFAQNVYTRLHGDKCKFKI